MKLLLGLIGILLGGVFLVVGLTVGFAFVLTLGLVLGALVLVAGILGGVFSLLGFLFF